MKSRRSVEKEKPTIPEGKKVKNETFPTVTMISTLKVELSWHDSLPLCALGAFSEERGGTVDLVDRHGYTVDEGRIPPHPTAQTSCLAWHPFK